jgi:outer membrane protein assembly factor BamE (lipoprotein component of BamABCDE complex)
MTEETQREVIAVRFDENSQVKSFAQYGLEDGRVIDVNTRQSPVYGEDTSILTTILRGSKGTRTGPMLGGKL